MNLTLILSIALITIFAAILYQIIKRRKNHAILLQDEADILDAKIFGPYEIRSFLGRDMFSSRFLGYSLEEEVDVELRILRRELALDMKLKQEFITRAKVLSDLHKQHPESGYPRVLDFGTVQLAGLHERSYASVETSKEVTLEEVLLETGSLNSRDAASILRSLLADIRVASSEHITFHAIFPENIRLRVDDNGTLQTSFNTAGIPFGHLPTMDSRNQKKYWYAPEARESTGTNLFATNTYALGSLFFFLTHGEQYSPEIFEQLPPALQQCLCEDPSQRSQSMDDIEKFIQALGEIPSKQRQIDWGSLLPRLSQKNILASEKLSDISRKKRAAGIEKKGNLMPIFGRMKVWPGLVPLAIAAISSKLEKTFNKPKKVYAAAVLAALIAVVIWLWLVVFPQKGEVAIWVMSTAGHIPIEGAQVTVKAYLHELPLDVSFEVNDTTSGVQRIELETDKHGLASCSYWGRFDPKEAIFDVKVQAVSSFLGRGETLVIQSDALVGDVYLRSVRRGKMSFVFGKVGGAERGTPSEGEGVNISAWANAGGELLTNSSFFLDSVKMESRDWKFVREKLGFEPVEHTITFVVEDSAEVLVQFGTSESKYIIEGVLRAFVTSDTVMSLKVVQAKKKKGTDNFEYRLPLLSKTGDPLIGFEVSITAGRYGKKLIEKYLVTDGQGIVTFSVPTLEDFWEQKPYVHISSRTRRGVPPFTSLLKQPPGGSPEITPLKTDF